MIQHTTPVSETQTIADASAAAKEREPVTTFRSRRSPLVAQLYDDERRPDYEKIKADYLKNRPPRRVDPSRNDENIGTGEATIPLRVIGRGGGTAATPATGTERSVKGTPVTIEATPKSGEARTRVFRRSEEATPITKAIGQRGEASLSPVSTAGHTMFGVQRGRPAPTDEATTSSGSSKLSPFVEDIPEPPLIAAAKAANEKQKAGAAAKDRGTTTDKAAKRTRSATKPVPSFRISSAAGIGSGPAAKNEAANRIRAAAKHGGAARNQDVVSDEGTDGHEVLIRKGSTARGDAGRHHRRTSSLRGPTKYRPGPPPGTELIRQPGRQASLRAYWDHRRDGMWDVTWEGGLDHGFDVVICVIYIKLD